MSQNIIPAHCSNCGAIFKSRLISISGNVTGLTLSGNKESCPYCGSMANTAEGIFDITDNIIKVISSPEITKEMLDKFSNVVKDAYNNKIDMNTLVSEANEIDPKLGNLIKIEKARGFLTYTLLVLLSILTSACSVDVNVSVDVNKLIEQMMETPPAKVVGQSSFKSKITQSKIDSQDKVLVKSTNTSKKKIGRNVICPCGSGIKFKKCCGKMRSQN